MTPFCPLKTQKANKDQQHSIFKFMIFMQLIVL